MTVQAQDHYAVLGIHAGAQQDEVKKAYRALSKLYHPDKAVHLDEAGQRQCEEQMVKLNVAYQALNSPRSRKEYDLTQPKAGPTATPSTSDFPRGTVPGTAGFRPAAPATSKPRYQLGAKYTQRSRQARRMDPSQYTTHIDGRAAEFAGRPAAQDASSDAPAYSPADPDFTRNLPWEQRDLDLAKEWEEAHCPPEPPEERYQWTRATDGILKNLRERRQQKAC